MAGIVIAETVTAPQDNYLPVEELAISDSFISSLTERHIDKIPPLILNEVNKKYLWNEVVAYNVMIAESGGNPSSVNPTDHHKGCLGSFGLYQLACLHGTKEELLDPKKNTEIAYELWKREGWSPWSVCTKGIVKCY